MPSRGPGPALRRWRPAIFPSRPSGRRSAARNSGGARSPPGRGRSPAATHRLRPGAGVRWRAPMQSPQGGWDQSIWPYPLEGFHRQGPRAGRGGSVAFLGQPSEMLAERLRHVRRPAAGPHAHPVTSAGLLRSLPPALPSLPHVVATRFWGSAQCPNPTVSAHRAAGVSVDAYRVRAGAALCGSSPPGG